MNSGDSNPATAQGVIVFTIADQPFDARDIVDAAWFRGELQAAWQSLLAGLAAAEAAAESTPDGEQLQVRSEEVRYRHDLITSEETEAWLATRGLSIEDLTDYCLRHYWRERATGTPAAAAVEFPAATAEQRERLLHDLLFSGAFETLAQGLAWRVAAATADGGELPAGAIDAQRERCLCRAGLEAEQLPAFLEQLGRDQAWWERLLGWECVFDRICAQVCTTENRARSLAALRLALTRFEVELLDLESEAAAREACLCLTVDGLSLAELAEQERCPIERRECVLEDFSAELQLRFLSAEPGHVLPLISADRFQVCRILAKREPTLADEDVVQRVDRELCAAHFEHLVSQHLIWQLKPSGTV